MYTNKREIKKINKKLHICNILLLVKFAVSITILIYENNCVLIITKRISGYMIYYILIQFIFLRINLSDFNAGFYKNFKTFWMWYIDKLIFLCYEFDFRLIVCKI